MQGLRESLMDIIYDISPEETPFMSSAGVGPRATQTLVEWQTDALEAVNGSNAVVEGDDPKTFSTPAASVRVGNYCQISDKTIAISDTLEVVDKAGRRSELAYQVSRKGRALKRDQETIFLRAQGGDSGGLATARTLAAMLAWVKTNTSFYTTDGADPVYTSGVPAVPRTDGGTLRAFTETIAKDVIQQGWTAGAMPNIIMVGPVNKQRVSGFAGIATQNIDQTAPKPAVIVGSANLYVSDFGTFRVIPNRFQRERDAWFMDFEYVEVRYLRPHQVVKLAKTGDNEKRHLKAEYTLVVKNEAALGGAFDLTTT
jgi:hypothetical protein